jgi:hypothetical protein
MLKRPMFGRLYLQNRRERRYSVQLYQRLKQYRLDRVIAGQYAGLRSHFPL